MKKLYTLALSALVLAASASAAAPTARIAKAKFTETVSERIEPNKRLVKVSPQRTLAAKAATKQVKISNERLLEVAVSQEANLKAVKAVTPNKVVRKAGEEDGIAGAYILTIGDYYLQGSSDKEEDYDCTVTQNGSTLTFLSKKFKSDVDAEYDAAAGTITFSPKFLGQWNITGLTEAYVKFETFYYDYDLEKTVSTPSLTATYDATKQTITFPADNGFRWAVYKSSDCTTESYAGVLTLFDVVKLVKQNFDWRVIDETAQFKENIIYGSFIDGNPENTKFETLTVLQDFEHPTNYKILNAYKTLYAALGYEAESPELVFNVTDPTSVTVSPQLIGLQNSTDGVYKVGSYGNYAPTTDEQKITFEKQTDGSVKVTFPYHSMALEAPAAQKLYRVSPYVSELTFTPNSEPEAETWTLLEGKGVYAPSVLPAMYKKTAVPVEVDVYESNQHKGVYKFVGVWPEFGENLELVIDASDPDYVVVPEQNTGFVDEKDGITYIASQSALFARAELEAEYPEVVITMKDGYINIQADALLLRWPEAPADSEYETDPEEWYGIETCPDGYALLPGGTMPDPNEGWKSVGDATLMDGWVIPAFGDQTDPSMWYTVELQQNEANENLYRLVAPYHSEGFPGLELNECATPGYIQFDVTDPDHVVFAANVAAGFSVAEIELPNIYCTNVLGSLSAMFGIDPQSIVTIIGSDIPYTTFKDGVVSLDVFHGVDEESGEEFTTYDATFGVTPNNAVSAWYDEEDNPSDMTTRIWFPGVTPSYEQGGIVEITAETGAETVYNLRGQRVGKVMNPGIYIVNNRKVVVK